MLVELSLAAIIFTYCTIGLCRLSGLVDQPDARKQHSGAVPLAGGIAIFATWLYSVFRLGLEPYSEITLVVIGAVFALGLLDDRLHLKPSLRLLLHYGAGIAMATWAGVEILNVGNLLAMGDIPLL